MSSALPEPNIRNTYFRKMKELAIDFFPTLRKQLACYQNSDSMAPTVIWRLLLALELCLYQNQNQNFHLFEPHTT